MREQKRVDPIVSILESHPDPIVKGKIRKRKRKEPPLQPHCVNHIIVGMRERDRQTQPRNWTRN